MTHKNTKFILDFRNQLSTHFVSQQQAREDGIDLAENPAKQFAKRIIASRKERDWTRSYCAKMTQIPETTLFSLEKGLILTSNIKSEWCHQLALAYGEDIATYEELLGRKLPSTPSYSYYLRLYESWAVRFFASKSKFYLVFGLMWLTLIGWLMNAFLTNFDSLQVLKTTSVFIHPMSLLALPQLITAVSIFLITLWLIILKGDLVFNWIQNRKNQLLPLATACLILVIIQNLLLDLPYHFQCQFDSHTFLCQSEIVTGRFIYLLFIFTICVGVTAVLFKFGRPMIRFLHTLHTQRKLVYLSVLLSFIMSLLFLRSSNVNALADYSAYRASGTLEQQIALLEMPSYQQLSPAENKLILKKLWHSEPASNFRTQIQGQKLNLPFALFQFSVTIFLNILIGIAICKKGKFISAFSKQ